jgi:hypothetical protein
MARTMIALAIVAMFALAGVAQAQPRPDTASLQIQFDNRGSKVEGKKSTLIAVVARMLKVDPKSVSMNVIGQSGLLNHQSVATFTATGPTTNGKSVYTNCAESVKSGWFTKAAANKEINKATDTWMPGDSVKVEKATCSAPGQKQVSGRKML